MEKEKEHSTIADHVFDAMAEGVPRDYDNPPELPDEVKKINAIKSVARQNIIRYANEYIATPLEDREGKKHLLMTIQQICDALDDAFVLVVPQKDGSPYSITFNPRTPEKVSTKEESVLE